MALIVEDGTGKADAESYISVADATTYHANRGNSTWAALASDTVREQALRKATDYMEQSYRIRWKGYRVNSTQKLSWPRYEVKRIDQYGYMPSDYVPLEVQNACAELALKAASEDLAPDLEQGVKREKIGPIETEYDTASAPFKVFRAVDNMLSPLFGNVGGVFRKVIRT